ncbi:IPExxxVDY family protein [Sphingobacterium psychroaquaticum]|uniref:IPExxxVDY family protein n=1 Tax=Sphingobacterium psychroaquaticum TaxID=561061 RepID=A0A1X7J987_9SPHI|nr:IPExxxVDY family protein [Sphingobacterium psychroaquaticum]SMG24373.1 hypothetical protein SAMN05660862_1634 [Sphingobacterium psychroaquaticum]
MSITKKHLLLDFELELDFSLIGISSPLRDYRLSHFIFKHTGLELVRGKENYIDHKGYLKDKDKDEMDYHIVFERTKQKKTSKYHYTIYRCCDENFEFEYYLINNRSIEGGILIPELPNFDYFFMAKHFIDPEDLRNLLEDIKTIQEVLLVKELDPTALKSNENLIF